MAKTLDPYTIEEIRKRFGCDSYNGDLLQKSASMRGDHLMAHHYATKAEIYQAVDSILVRLLDEARSDARRVTRKPKKARKR